MKTWRLPVLAVLFVGLPATFVMACSGDDSTAIEGTDSGTGSDVSIDTSVTPDAAPPSDAAPTDAGTDTGTTTGPLKAAEIFVTQPLLVDGGHRSVFGANFFDGTCAVTTAGTCAAHVCTTPLTPGNQGQGDEGPITFHAPLLNAQVDGGVVIDPTDAGNYPGLALLGVTSFAPGNTVTIAAAGGSLPAFAATMVTATTDIKVTMPSFVALGTVTLSRAAPLAVAWTGGTTGKVVVSLLATDGTERVTCTFDAAAGTGEVPAALLSKLKPHADGQLSVLPHGGATFLSGAARINLAAISAGASGPFSSSD